MEVASQYTNHRLKMSRNSVIDVATALSEKSKGNPALYRVMVQDIASATRLVGWFSMLAKSVTHISESHFELIEALISFNWWNSIPQEMDAYISLLVSLTFVNSTYLEKIYTALISCFRGVPKQAGCIIEDSKKVDEQDKEIVLENIHKAIQTLLQAHPTSITVLRHVIGEKYPHRVWPASTHALFAEQALRIISYCPSLRKDILELIIDNMAQIDVELKTEIKPRFWNSFDMNDDILFALESTGDTAQKPTEMDENEDKMDIILTILLKWLSKYDEMDMDDSIVLDDVFKVLLGAFDRILLPSNQTKYSQWPLFYICSLKEQYTSEFLSHLFDILQNPKVQPAQRQRACMYISSFTARARYIKELTNQSVISHMCEWMVKYEAAQHDPHPEVGSHLLYYAIFHGISYILNNLHDNLFDTLSAKHTIKELGLVDIGRSKLNPLKVCSPYLVHIFTTVLSKYGISFTAVLQHNERLILPAKSVFSPNGPLTDFFPFDPHFLKSSSSFLIPLYNNDDPLSSIRGHLSGYDTEGETEMDLDADDGLHLAVDIDLDDTHTTESMMAMMDFGRGSINDKRKEKSEGIFGSFDEKTSSCGSGTQSRSGSFVGNSFGATSFGQRLSPQPPSSSGATTPISASNGQVIPNQLFPAMGSFTEPRIQSNKRNREEWSPSTPLSAAMWNPSAHRTFAAVASDTPITPITWSNSTPLGS